ncbi:MAG: DUF6933 domain-containing protein [Chthoniobacteraceae bacterium]
MILHASRSIAERLKCQVSTHSVFQKLAVDSWSFDLFKMAKVGTFAVVMNDASLSTFIVPLKGIRTFEVFLPQMLARIGELFDRNGIPFDAQNQSVLILPRSARSLIGTMNEAKAIIKDSILYDLKYVGAVDWVSLERELNETPYSQIEDETPDTRMGRLS